jgi:protein-tyrosine phosphatase
VIDLHCHVLPGIDDGPDTLEEAVELVRAAAATGAKTIVATPHVSPRYQNDSSGIADGVALVNARLAVEGVPVDVLAGAEIAFPRIADLAEGELDRLRLAGGHWLLLESPFKTPVESLPAVLAVIQGQGHRILLAHPERSPGFHRRPDVLETLIHDQQILASVTAGSLTGQFGREVEGYSIWMAENGLIGNVASDAHDCVRRPPGIAEAMEQAGLGAHIELLAHDVPRAILTGAPLPQIPSCLLPGRDRSAWRPWGRSSRSRG